MASGWGRGSPGVAEVQRDRSTLAAGVRRSRPPTLRRHARGALAQGTARGTKCAHAPVVAEPQARTLPRGLAAHGRPALCPMAARPQPTTATLPQPLGQPQNVWGTRGPAPVDEQGLGCGPRWQLRVGPDVKGAARVQRPKRGARHLRVQSLANVQPVTWSPRVASHPSPTSLGPASAPRPENAPDPWFLL